MLVALVLFDLATIKKLNSATIIGGGIIVVYQVVAVLLWDAAFWLTSADQIDTALTRLLS